MSRAPEPSTPAPTDRRGADPLVWSVMIPTYNCAALLRDTLVSVLDQDPGPEVMQIEVVDDASIADDPESVVREVAGDRVGFFRQPENLGHVGNFNTCVRRARGRLVHLLHGDDLVLPGFYEAMEARLEDPGVGMAFARNWFVDDAGRRIFLGPEVSRESGPLANALEIIASTQPIQPPAVVVRRDVYEDLGGFDSRMSSCGEDWEMWVRIASRYPVSYETEPRAAYRVRTGSLSGKSFRSGKNIRDVLLAIQIYSAYLPDASRSSVVRRARRHAARWGIRMAKRMLARGDWAGARAQLAEAYRARLDPDTILRGGLLIPHAVAGVLRTREER